MHSPTELAAVCEQRVCSDPSSSDSSRDATAAGYGTVLMRQVAVAGGHRVASVRNVLARELAERVFAYVRGARLAGWTAHPVSAILTGSVTLPAASSLPPPL